MLYPVYQYRLVSGDEILAEVIEFPDDGTSEIICRNVLQIDAFFREETFEKYYAFKPYNHCVDGPMDFTIINSNHIISTTTPSSDLMSSYIDARDEGHKISESRESEHQMKQNMRLKEATEQIRQLIDESREAVNVEKKDSKVSSNIIRFPDMEDDDTIH